MKHVWIAVVVVLVSVSPVARAASTDLALDPSESNKVYGADIQLTNDWKLKVTPSSLHAPVEASLQIKESDSCDWKRLSDTEIQVGAHCDFMAGLYRYNFQVKGDAKAHQVAIAFTLSRPRGDGRIFMVSPALEITE